MRVVVIFLLEAFDRGNIIFRRIVKYKKKLFAYQSRTKGTSVGEGI